LSGIEVDRGTQDNALSLFNEANVTVNGVNLAGSWQLKPAALGSAEGGDLYITNNTVTAGANIETEQVSIGDGVNTFGTYDADVSGNISSALTSALADVSSGGKIFVKRGTYTLDSSVTVSNSGVSIEGEGASTNIQVDAASNQLVVTGNEFMLHKLKFTSTTSGTSNAMLDMTGGSPDSARSIVEKVWFIGSGNTDLDISYDQFKDNLVSNCISTTSSTNLP
jgi:hypothetical protein